MLSNALVARVLATGLLLIALPSAAQAAGGTPIPEASSTVLFALGVLGVLIGRRASMRKRDK